MLSAAVVLVRAVEVVETVEVHGLVRRKRFAAALVVSAVEIAVFELEQRELAAVAVEIGGVLELLGGRRYAGAVAVRGFDAADIARDLLELVAKTQLVDIAELLQPAESRAPFGSAEDAWNRVVEECGQVLEMRLR